jgi:hypothetical protein
MRRVQEEHLDLEEVLGVELAKDDDDDVDDEPGRPQRAASLVSQSRTQQPSCA